MNNLLIQLFNQSDIHTQFLDQLTHYFNIEIIFGLSHQVIKVEATTNHQTYTLVKFRRQIEESLIKII